MWQLSVEQALHGDELEGKLSREAVLTATVINAGEVRSMVDASTHT